METNVSCHICGNLIDDASAYVRLDGLHPAHKKCCDDRGRLYRLPVTSLQNVYRMILDWSAPCPKCGNEGTILIKSDNPDFPTFHYCGCERPTFVMTQDNVGEIPSFARAIFDA
jgi:hypothetical protein